MSIRLKLTLWYAGILAFTLLILGVSLYSFLSINSMNANKTSLNTELTRVGDRLTTQLYESSSDFYFGPGVEGHNPFTNEGLYLQVNNLLNDTISRSSNADSVDLTIPLSKSDLVSLKKKVQVENVKELNGYPFLVISKPITLDGETIGILSGALLMKSHYDFLSTVRNLLLLMSLVVVVGAATTGWYMAKKALKPIDNITEMADQIQKADDLNNRVYYEGPADELGRLTLTINNMLSRVEIAYHEQSALLNTQRRFVSDASHELRTPLTSIRGNVALLKKMVSPTTENEMTLESIEDIDAESERMSRLVSDLLSLARADSGLKMDKTILPIKEVIDAGVKRANFLPKTAHWETSDLDSAAEVYVYGNADYLLQMMMVFVENAFKYTPAGTVKLTTTMDGGRIGIVVEDSGIGIGEHDVPHLFDRFFRADVSRGQTAGTGLGLAIAKWIVDEHHGEVEVRTALGKGTRFTIWLPTSEKV